MPWEHATRGPASISGWGVRSRDHTEAWEQQGQERRKDSLGRGAARVNPGGASADSVRGGITPAWGSTGSEVQGEDSEHGQLRPPAVRLSLWAWEATERFQARD